MALPLAAMAMAPRLKELAVIAMGEADGAGTSGNVQTLGLPYPSEAASFSGLVVPAKYEIGSGMCCCHDEMPTIGAGISVRSGAPSDCK